MTQFANPVTLPLSAYEPRHFLLSVDGPLATVTLNRPDARNALNAELIGELTRCMEELAGDDELVYIGDGYSDRCAAEA